MAGNLFIHENHYARKAAAGKAGGHSIRSIIAEAKRELGAHPHVEDPQQPKLLHGVGLDDVERIATEYAETVKDSRGRKLRTDAVVLLAGVVTAPPAMTDAEWQAYHLDAVEALRERYGDRLLSVIEHEDEPLRDPPPDAKSTIHRHIHYYAVPLPGERFDQVLAPGRAAKGVAEAEAKRTGADAKTAGKAGDDAFKAERRQFLNWFHERVGIRHGLTRVGPRRRRLSRAQWSAEQQAAEAAALALAKASTASTEAAQIVQAAQAQAAEALASADAQAVQVVDGAKRRAGAIRKKAEAAGLKQGLAKAKTLGAQVGAAWSAVREAVTGPLRKLRDQLRERERAHATALRTAREEAAREASVRAEREVANLRQELRHHASDAEMARRARDKAQAALDALRTESTPASRATNAPKPV